MTTHVIVQPTIAALARYRAVGGVAVAKHGGAVLAGGIGEVLAQGGGADTCALLTFPNDQAARDWIAEPEGAEVDAFRDFGAKSTIVVIPPL